MMEIPVAITEDPVKDREMSVKHEKVRTRHREARALQEEIKAWMTRKNYILETGIRFPARQLAIYIPPGPSGEMIMADILSDFPSIREQAILTELKKGTRKRLSMHPGRTPLFFGDGTSATLGTFLRVVNEDKMYALSSFHCPAGYPIIDRDVSIKLQHGPHLQEGPEIFRLGRVVSSVCQPSPVLDACLIEIDPLIYDKIDLTMPLDNTDPPLYLKMHQHAEDLGEECLDDIKVSKYGYGTKRTSGYIFEYSREIEENGRLLTHNIVTKSEDLGVFSTDGDSGSVIMRAVRIPIIGVDNIERVFFEAISLLYMADGETGESFSIPLPRCLTALGNEVGCDLELATERFTNSVAI